MILNVKNVMYNVVLVLLMLVFVHHVLKDIMKRNKVHALKLVKMDFMVIEQHKNVKNVMILVKLVSIQVRIVVKLVHKENTKSNLAV